MNVRPFTGQDGFTAEPAEIAERNSGLNKTKYVMWICCPSDADQEWDRLESTAPRVGEETDKNRSLRVLCDLSGERIVISHPFPFWGCPKDSVKLIFEDYE